MNDILIFFLWSLQDRIIFVSFLAAQIGLTVINNAFPRVKIVTSMVDPDLNKEKLWIVPGIGNFGGTFQTIIFPFFLELILCLIDRYFGTEEDEE